MYRITYDGHCYHLEKRHTFLWFFFDWEVIDSGSFESMVERYKELNYD